MPGRRFRGLELLLLLLATGASAIGFASLRWAGGAPPWRPEALWPAGLLLGVALTVHVGLTLSRRPADEVLLPLVVTLIGLGLVLAQRLGGDDLLRRQALWLTIGGALLTLLLFAPHLLFFSKRFQFTWAALGLLLVALTAVFGEGPGAGAPKLALSIGPLTFQPAEPLKLLLVLFFAGYLADTQAVLLRTPLRWGGTLPYVLPLLLMLSLGVALLILQRDLGTAILLFGSFILLLYLATAQWLYPLAGLGGVAAAIWLSLRIVPLVQQRVSIWLDPWSQASDRGYQVVQGFIAIASGGLLGRGLGQGMPDVVPAAHTDFVFAAIAEELGLLGAAAVLCAYLLLVHRGFRIALDARHSYARFLAAGSIIVIGLQALIILGGNLGLLPLTGLTLPFLSYGGSSLVTNMVLVGLLLSASRPETAPAAVPRPARPRLEAQATLTTRGQGAA